MSKSWFLPSFLIALSYYYFYHSEPKDSKNEAFIFTWHIENFYMCPQNKGEAIKSPAFVVDALDKTRWHLELFPKGEDSFDGDYVSFYLRRKSDRKKEPYEIVIDYSIHLANADLKLPPRTRNTFEKYQGRTKGVMVSREHLIKNKNTLLPNDVLTLRCSMWRVTNEKELPAEGKILSDATDVGTTPERRPTQCSAYTRIPVERTQITWNIGDFENKMRSAQKIPISVVSALRDNSALVVNCYSSGDWDRDRSARIDIRRKDRDMKQTLVKCKVSVLDGSGVVRVSREDEHLFGEDFEVWSFPPVIESSTLSKSGLLDGGVFTMALEFQLSYKGEEIPIGGAGLQTYDPIDADDLRQGLTDLLADREFNDAILVSENLQFDVHKTVICAQSPVFRAMFSGDTEESRTGVVHITDMDAKTVKNLILFLYEGFVPELHPEDAIKLYWAADKYQISTLKEECASFFKYSLSLSNVCDVLVLADRHRSSDLVRSVHNFVHMYWQDVFVSSEWMKLMESHPQLTGEIMRKVLDEFIV